MKTFNSSVVIWCAGVLNAAASGLAVSNGHLGWAVFNGLISIGCFVVSAKGLSL